MQTSSEKSQHPLAMPWLWAIAGAAMGAMWFVAIAVGLLKLLAAALIR